VSTPLRWDEVPDCDAADFTVLTVPKRFAEIGDPHAEMDAHVGSLDALLEMAARDKGAGLADAPWPPHYRKMDGEAARVAPSRARAVMPAAAALHGAATAAKPAGRRVPTMPLLVLALSPSKDLALAGLERWKAKYPDAAKHLEPADTLVDSMRGRSSTWTRIRVNLRHVPEELRPPQETPDPDDDPTRAFREGREGG
jgi:hypothetical protein